MTQTRVYWLALALTPGIGGKTARKLVERFGNIEAVFTALVEELTAIPRVTEQVAQNITSAPLEQIEQELWSLEEEGIDLLAWGDDNYPTNLGLVDDAPIVLFVRGALRPSDTEAIAIVGAREASPQGQEWAMALARGLAELGFTIVSGLAKGIDTVAHRGALAAGGRTLAVLGSGLRVIHPRENVDLAQQIISSGALLSELHPDTPPRGPQLMARDRIISGLSKAVIVVEATESSGSLDTAEKARRQGRLVFAVEGGGPGVQELLAGGALKISGAEMDYTSIAAQVRDHPLGVVKSATSNLQLKIAM
jgi:DNA processing protein